MIRFLFAVLIACTPAFAEEQVVAGMSQNRVSITANFDGSEILIFGAVRRESPPPSEHPLEVIVTIEGPDETLPVRRKENRFGIWVNTDTVVIDRAPSFYAVATTGPLNEILSDTEDLRHQVSIRRAIRSMGADFDIENPEDFTEALIRIREKNDLYQMLEGQVEVSEETLFNTSVALPSNLHEGEYTVRIMLTRGLEVVDVFESNLDVSKVGLERWIYNLAHEKPLIYGFLSLFIAIAAGWMASAVFRLIRN